MQLLWWSCSTFCKIWRSRSRELVSAEDGCQLSEISTSLWNNLLCTQLQWIPHVKMVDFWFFCLIPNILQIFQFCPDLGSYFFGALWYFCGNEFLHSILHFHHQNLFLLSYMLILINIKGSLWGSTNLFSFVELGCTLLKGSLRPLGRITHRK